jgi:short subunit dehydrogenase-like uncharacterized protein
LLGYSKELKYGDAKIKTESFTGWMKGTGTQLLLGAAIAAPSIFQQFLTQPGDGPSREDMENGFLNVYGLGTMVEKDGEQKHNLASKFHFNKDTGYLYTAVLLVETGMLLVEKCGTLSGGCKTPASALGNDLTQRIVKEMEASFEVKEVES